MTNMYRFVSRTTGNVICEHRGKTPLEAYRAWLVYAGCYQHSPSECDRWPLPEELRVELVEQKEKEADKGGHL